MKEPVVPKPIPLDKLDRIQFRRLNLIVGEPSIDMDIVTQYMQNQGKSVYIELPTWLTSNRKYAEHASFLLREMQEQKWPDQTIRVFNDYFLDRVRIEAAAGRFPYEEVQFLYVGKSTRKNSKTYLHTFLLDEMGNLITRESTDYRNWEMSEFLRSMNRGRDASESI